MHPSMNTSIHLSRHGDGYIVMGFSNGYFVVISTHLKEIGQVMIKFIRFLNLMKSKLAYLEILKLTLILVVIIIILLLITHNF